MSKADFVNKLQLKAGFDTKVVTEKALDALVEAITEALQSGDAVTLTGFGSFKVTERAARSGRNPHTQETIEIPSSKVVKFTPGKVLKDAVK